MIICALRSLKSHSMDISTSTNININTMAKLHRLQISTTAAVRLNHTGDSTDSRLRGRLARMGILVHLHLGRQVATGVVVHRSLHLVVVGSRVLDLDLEGDSILPRVRTGNLLPGHPAGVGILRDTELLQGKDETERMP
jgi:hypothetical protein